MGIAIDSSGGVLVILMVFLGFSLFIDTNMYFFIGAICGHIVMMLIDKFVLSEKHDE